jgi:hypothetical protein
MVAVMLVLLVAYEKGQGQSDIDASYFGGCPICSRNDGYLNTWKEYWFSRREHKTRWLWDVSLVGTWRYENEEDWDSN